MTVDLRPGDVLLAGHHGSPIARCVQILSDSPWNHAAIVSSDPDTLIHCPGPQAPVVATMPVTGLLEYLQQPGFGPSCLTVLRPVPAIDALAAARRAEELLAEQPFDYSLGQDLLLGVLLWSQQQVFGVNLVIGAVLEQFEQHVDDVISEQATSCVEFVWQCFDDTGAAVVFDEPYYGLGPGERRQRLEVAHFPAVPGSPQHPAVPHAMDTPLNRLVERIVLKGHKPRPKKIVRAVRLQEPTVRYVLPERLDASDEVIPDLLVPRDVADSPSFVVVGGWP